MSPIADILIQEKFICCLSEIHILLGDLTRQPYLEEQGPGLFCSVLKFQQPYHASLPTRSKRIPQGPALNQQTDSFNLPEHFISVKICAK